MTDTDPLNGACLGVCAVVVTFHPQIHALEHQLAVLARQVGGIVVVDNGSSEGVCRWLEQQVLDTRSAFIPLGTNTGIAAAQNRGISWSAENGFDHVLLMDQDSIPSEKMVQNLVKAARTLELQGVKVGAVGPVCLDPRTGQAAPFARFDAGRLQLARCHAGETFIPASVLMASGSLIPNLVLKDVGSMDAELFIDEVDHEWCLRAGAKGYQIFGVCSALLHHTVGDNIVQLWILRRRSYNTHSPLRNYYRIRNIFLLIRRPYMRNVCGKFMLYNALVIFIVNVLAGNAWQQLRSMLRGLCHGLLNKAGKLEVGVAKDRSIGIH